MQLKAREDIEAPLDKVFAALSDLETVERQALRRGIDVQRIRGGGAPTEGMAWRVVFTFRGKEREAEITLTEYTPPERMVFSSISGGLKVVMVMDVVALSRTRTRITTSSDARCTISVRVPQAESSAASPSIVLFIAFTTAPGTGRGSCSDARARPGPRCSRPSTRRARRRARTRGIDRPRSRGSR